MTFNKWTYLVEPEITLAASDIDFLISCTQKHYDGKCQDAGKVGGFIYGWKNMLFNAATVTVYPTFHQIDLITKILESYREVSDLSVAIVEFFNKLAVFTQKESERVNFVFPVKREEVKL